MSNKKSRKQKLALQERKKLLQEEQEKMNRLQNEKLSLENMYKDKKREQIKQFHIRNLRVFSHTCNFLAPFVISTGIMVGTFALFGGGLPVKVDNVKKYKVYNLEYETGKEIILQDEYKTNHWFEDSIPSNSFLIYTPWEVEEGQYVRYKREYELDSFDRAELFNAVLKENMEYVQEHLKDFKEEKQISCTVPEENTTVWQVDLHVLDKSDVLLYKETELMNIIITIAELLLGLSIGAWVAYARDFEYIYEVKKENSIYQLRVQAVKNVQRQVEEIEQQIASLSLKKGSR